MTGSYFPIYKSSSSNTATTATTGSELPITPPTIHAIPPGSSSTSKPHFKQKSSSGYESDSSDEEGRRLTLPQQGLTLRVTNPDTDGTCMTTPTTREAFVGQHQQTPRHVPDLPPHNIELNTAAYSTTLPHRESKTLAAVSMHEAPVEYEKKEVLVYRLVVFLSCPINKL